MATNKIYFNNTTNLVTLKGVYYNGTKIEGCKGIKLNGNIVVSFETVIPILDWTDYTIAYNNVWGVEDTSPAASRMGAMTAQNEFAICRSAWMLYTRKTFIESLTGGQEAKMFNFNADGRLYIGEDVEANWQNGDMERYGDIKITSPHNQIPIWDNASMFTGLPLIYKTEGGEFAGTFICNGSTTDNAYDISYDEYWTIFVAKDTFSQIISYEGNALTIENIAEAIRSTLGVEAIAQGSVVEVTGSADWGEFEFLDAISHVYIPKFGPFYVNEQEILQDDELYHLSRNRDFLAQSYWRVLISSDIIIKKYWTADLCDLYILTGWGLEYIKSRIGDNMSSGNYYLQGEGNAEVNITYFDTSALAGLKCPNILCSQSIVYSALNTDITNPSGESESQWAGIYDINDYGNITPSPIFPTDCPFNVDFGASVPEIPITVDDWIVANNLQDVEVEFALIPTPWEDENNPDPDENNMDGSDLIPSVIAERVFGVCDSGFPYNTPTNPTRTVIYDLRLKMRTYPSYAISNGTRGNYWYLNSYDPYNVGGYYPVEKTTTTAAGTMYSTVCNYGGQSGN